MQNTKTAQPLKPVPTEGFFTAAVMYIPRKFSSAYDAGTSRSGAARILKPLMLSYCALLSIETIYVALPVAGRAIGGESYTTELKAQDLRFAPKAFISDGADITRLSPLPNLQRAAVDLLPLPAPLKTRLATDKVTVWDLWPQLLLAVAIAMVIQSVEAWAWRKASPSAAKADFYKFNAIKKVTASRDAVAVAHLKAKQYNQYGTGGATIRFSLMLMLYALEFGAFKASFIPGAKLWATVVYGLLTVFGWEVTIRLFEDDDA